MPDKRIRVSLTADQRHELEEASEASGLAISDLLKVAYFSKDRFSPKRKPTADRVALARIVGQLGKLGCNVNQISHQLNSGKIPPSRDLILCLQGAQDEVKKMGGDLRQALGISVSEGV